MSDTDTEDVNPNVSWRVPCRECILHVHAGGVSRHYANKHPGMSVPEELHAKHLAYRRFRRQLKFPSAPRKPKASRPVASHQRSSIPFLRWHAAQIEPFVQFITSDFGGSLDKRYARELGVIYGKIACFEYQDVKQVDEMTDAQRDEDLCNEGRIIRLLQRLEEAKARGSTRQKWLQCIFKAVAWRAHLLRKEKVQTEEMKERIRKLEAVEPHWSKFKTSLYGRKQKEQRAAAKSVEERKEDGNWCSTEEWKAAVEQSALLFQTIVEKAKNVTPGHLPVNDYVTALNFCLALYFCENRPQRPGFLAALTLSEWNQIEEKKSYATRNFKTSALYGEQQFTFGAQTLKVWKLYADHIRPHAAGGGQLFFVTSGGNPIKVARCLTEFSYVTMGRHITPTTLRAIVATEAEDKLGPEEAQKVHRADTHSIQTVQRHYDKRAAARVAEAADAVYTRLVGAPVLDNLVTNMDQSPEIDLTGGDTVMEDDPTPPSPVSEPQVWSLASPPAARGEIRIAFSKNEVLFISTYGRYENAEATRFEYDLATKKS